MALLLTRSGAQALSAMSTECPLCSNAPNSCQCRVSLGAQPSVLLRPPRRDLLLQSQPWALGVVGLGTGPWGCYSCL